MPGTNQNRGVGGILLCDPTSEEHKERYQGDEKTNKRPGRDISTVCMIQDEREQVEKELQEIMKYTGSLRRDFARVSMTNVQRVALEGSAVFRDTELGSLIEDSEEAGLDMALLAQVLLFTAKRYCVTAG